jgi:hypothetical protein
MGKVDPRLEPLAEVLGVELGGGKDASRKAYPLDGIPERHAYNDEVDGRSIAVLWYAPTRSAVAFEGRTASGEGAGDHPLTLRADDIAPETAPFVDEETHSRWTLAGRAVDGPLKGRELVWVPSIQCRWYAWAAEYPETALHARGK